MLDKKITFDSFIRSIMTVLIVVAIILLINRLSSVLLPFFIAWLLAYMLYPLVRFLQYRCRLQSRIVSIIVALLLVLGALTGVMFLVVPPIIEEATKMSELVAPLADQYLGQSGIAESVQRYVQRFFTENDIVQLIQQDNVRDALQTALGQVWNFIYQTMGFIVGIFTVFTVFLYMFFILLDYEKISTGFINLIPQAQRPFATQLLGDVESGMNSYFRGQSLIALIVGILFSIGFLIIDFPLAVGLGLFIGLLNLVPYLQLIGFIPTIILALMKSLETGQNFWLILLLALIVFAVVQTIQDMYLTPRIMGKVMGLNPAVILLSLSVWGSLLGFIGLIVALPLTTLCLSYYRRLVLKEEKNQDLQNNTTDK
ncbi:MAG: AI-2E family transporter [Bacteroidaceae bacterium]|nr:AI-2E family transporter [Bacteroidaceae bacterium]